MKKTKKKVIFGLTVLTLISVLGKTTLRRILPIKINNNTTYVSEPDNYDGIQVLVFSGRVDFNVLF